MGRKRRIWIPHLFYHIVSRGNRRDALFKDDGDFKTFLYILQEVAKRTPFELASYCLMTNHFHLQLRSIKQPISKVMSLINKRYADYYNTKNNLSGHVFEKRYYDKMIPSKQAMLEVSRYIHLNPVDSNMVKRPEQYRWSSYRYYIYRLDYNEQHTDILLSYFSGNDEERRKKYQAFVNRS